MANKEQLPSIYAAGCTRRMPLVIHRRPQVSRFPPFHLAWFISSKMASLYVSFPRQLHTIVAKAQWGCLCFWSTVSIEVSRNQSLLSLHLGPHGTFRKLLKPAWGRSKELSGSAGAPIWNLTCITSRNPPGKVESVESHPVNILKNGLYYSLGHFGTYVGWRPKSLVFLEAKSMNFDTSTWRSCSLVPLLLAYTAPLPLFTSR